MAITPNVRKKLLKLLPTNYRAVLAEQCEVHPQTIGNCLYGRTENKRIEIALLVLAKETKEAADRDDKQVGKIMKQISEA